MDVSLVGKNVSNLGILQGKGKKSAAEALVGGLDGGKLQKKLGYATLAFVSSFCKKE